MSLRDDILAWGQQLPGWQSDLVRKLCSTTKLSEAEIAETCLAVLAHFKCLGEGEAAPNLITLQDTDIPQSAEAGDTIRLVALKDLEGVNALETNQTLEFNVKGLTVIYGDNGSGKSSYARVLKEACRATDKRGRILSNVYSTDSHGSQRATIEIEVAGERRPLGRIVNSPPTPELSVISVFDSACASVYADGESEIAYVPSFLDIFSRLADAQTEVSERLRERVEKLRAAIPQFPEIDPSTKCGQLIRACSAKTPEAELKTLGVLSAEEEAQHSRLQADLALSGPHEALKLVAELRSKVAGLKAFRDKIHRLLTGIDNEKVRLLQEAYQRWVEAKALSVLLAKQAAEAENVPGIGSPAWRALWIAAEQYASEAFSEKTFPPTAGSDERCPLCHQLLAEEALVRFQRFQAVASGSAEQEVVKAKDALSILDRSFRELPVLQLTQGSPEHVLFAGTEPLEGLVVAYLKQLDLRRSAISHALAGLRTWDGLPDVPKFDLAVLDTTIQSLEARALELDTLANPNERAKAEKDFLELKARKLLAVRLPEALRMLSIYKQLAHLESANSALNTRAITAKKTDFTARAVTNILQEQLDKEICAFGLEYLRAKMGSRGSRGNTLVSVKLDTHTTASVSEVLSEGEQRALALAYFLAEVGAADHDGGIILDDPVSSMDHDRRGYVASRLAAEATKRQVIVFTHDIVFLLELHRRCEAIGVPCVEQVVRRIPGSIGLTDVALPWRAKNCKKKESQLRDELVRLRKHEKEGRTDEYEILAKGWLGRLREAWERAVEEKLFGNVVQRFRPSIETTRFEDVVVTADLLKEVEQGMTTCSNWVHDESPEIHSPIPDSKQLEVLLDTYKAFIAKADQIKAAAVAKA